MCCGICGCLACCACCACKAFTSQGVRTIYGIIFAIAISMAWFMRSEYMETAIREAPQIFGADCSGTADDSCFGSFGVYRVCLGLIFYHTLLFILTVGATTRGSFQGQMQNHFFLIKFLALVGLMVGAFMIPDEALVYFYYPALVMSIIFMLYHAYLIVDLTFNWVVLWREDRVGPLLMFTILFFAGFVTMTVFMYLYFSRPVPECQGNTALISINVVLFVIATVSSLLSKVQEKNADVGILQPMVMSIFTAVLLWSGLASQDVTSTRDCNNFANPNDMSSVVSSQNTGIITGMILMYILILWNIISPGISSPRKKNEVKTKYNELYVDAEDEDTDAEPEYNYAAFHLVFVFAAAYVALLLTGWNQLEASSTTNTFELQVSEVASWTTIVVSWIAWLLLFVAIFAPCCCPDREFGTAGVIG